MRLTEAELQAIGADIDVEMYGADMYGAGRLVDEVRRLRGLICEFPVGGLHALVDEVEAILRERK